MLRTYDMIKGIPPRIYRTPAEIRRDIEEISERIESANESLNIRSLITELLCGGEEPPERLIPELYEVVSEANAALSALEELNAELDALREELCEVRCLFGDRTIHSTSL